LQTQQHPKGTLAYPLSSSLKKRNREHIETVFSAKHIFRQISREWKIGLGAIWALSRHHILASAWKEECGNQALHIYRFWHNKDKGCKGPIKAFISLSLSKASLQKWLFGAFGHRRKDDDVQKHTLLTYAASPSWLKRHSSPRSQLPSRKA